MSMSIVTTSGQNSRYARIASAVVRAGGVSLAERPPFDSAEHDVDECRGLVAADRPAP